MTLRTRIAAVASLSVALAVLAAAVGLYVAVRSDLRGEVDRRCASARRAFLKSVGAGRPVGRAAGGGPADGATARWAPAAIDGGAPGQGPGRVASPAASSPRRSGAASGYVQFISPQGTVQVPGGQGVAPQRSRSRRADRAIAAAGSGQQPDRPQRQRHPAARAHAGTGTAAARC